MDSVNTLPNSPPGKETAPPAEGAEWTSETNPGASNHKDGVSTTGAGFELWPHQHDGVDGIFRSWDQYLRTLLVQPTGSGKTVTLSEVVRRRLAVGRVLVLAHTDELIQQARIKMYRARQLESDLEKAENRASLESTLVVSSVQTLSRPSRLERFGSDHFSTIIVDEAHRSLAPSYGRIMEHFGNAKLLGVTATPDRGDKKSLGAVFQDIAHEISLVELIRAGYLAPITVQTVPIKIDISKVAIRAGDFSEEELDQALDPVLEQVTQGIAEYARDRKTLVFTPLIRTADRFAQILRAAGFAAEFVSGRCVDRTEKLQRFALGETRILANAQLLTEGYDEPSIDCVIILRPTRSRPFFSQMAGRGFRIHPGKRDLLLLDFLWHTSKHSLIKPASLIAKDEKEAEQIERRLQAADGDLVKAHDIASQDRDKVLARAIRENAQRRARRVDILELELGLKATGLADYEPTMPWHFEGATDPQLAYIARTGIDPKQVRCKGEASAIIELLEKRRRLGLATFKQARLLRRLGHPKPHELTMSEAGAWIGRQLQQRRSRPVEPAVLTPIFLKGNQPTNRPKMKTQ
jgi:superfamily II DNA or RNA helicase